MIKSAAPHITINWPSVHLMFTIADTRMTPEEKAKANHRRTARIVRMDRTKPRRCEQRCAPRVAIREFALRHGYGEAVGVGDCISLRRHPFGTADLPDYARVPLSSVCARICLRRSVTSL